MLESGSVVKNYIEWMFPKDGNPERVESGSSGCMESFECYWLQVGEWIYILHTIGFGLEVMNHNGCHTVMNYLQGYTGIAG